MIRRALPCLLLLAPALGAGEILSYHARLDLATGQATATLVLAGAQGETIAVPVPFKAAGLQVTADAPGLRWEAGPRGLAVTLPGAGAYPLSYACAAPGAFAPEPVAEGEKASMPAASRLLRHRFVATEAAPVRDYRLEALLPSGWRFQAIKEQSPKPGKAEVEPRVRLGRAEGRESALLRCAGLKQGDTAAMVLEAVPTRRSPLWLVAGLAAALLYLVFFRDLVASRS